MLPDIANVDDQVHPRLLGFDTFDDLSSTTEPWAFAAELKTALSMTTGIIISILHLGFAS